MDQQTIEALKYYGDHPYEFVVDILNVTPNNQQTKVLRAIQKGIKHITIKSGHGTGKTTLLAWIKLWFFITRPFCKIPCTAPTQHQLFDILWAESAKWIARIKDPYLKEIIEWSATHIKNKHEPENWFAVARASSKPENMQGFHADELLFIIDEASGVDQQIMEAVEGALSTEGAMCIMTGNPTQLAGTFFDSFHKDRQYWECFTFSCEENDMVSQEYISRMKGKYGEDTNVYRVRVLGEFPKEEDDTVIPLSFAEQAANNEILVTDQREPVHIGVDVARFGNDKTVIATRQHRTVLSLDQYHRQSTMETVGYVMQLVAKYKDKCEVYVKVDDTGVGGGVTDRLQELLSSDEKVFISGINNGSKPKDNKYGNLGTELWFNMREHIRDWDVPRDDELIAELSIRKFKITSDGKSILERKEDMKKRGLNSPDKADALALAFYETRANKGFVLA